MNTALVCLIALLLYANAPTVNCQPNTAIEEYDCSEGTYDPNSGYGAEVDVGLDELAYMTVDEPTMQKVLRGQYATGFAYCQPTLTNRRDECIQCLEDANHFLREDCQYSVSAYVVMVDCGMRYLPTIY